MCILRETRAFDERTRAGAGMCDAFIMLLLVFFLVVVMTGVCK